MREQTSLAALSALVTGEKDVSALPLQHFSQLHAKKILFEKKRSIKTAINGVFLEIESAYAAIHYKEKNHNAERHVNAGGRKHQAWKGSSLATTDAKRKRWKRKKKDLTP